MEKEQSQISKDLGKKIQELQLIEQNLQNVLIQKQSSQIELTENSEALTELNKARGDVYKVVGQIMIRSKIDELKKELKDKKEVAELRIKNLEKQESSLKDMLVKLREEVMGKLQ